MGNKPVQPSDWINDFQNEKREPIWGAANVEKIPYPTFWPPAWATTSPSRGDIQFGRIYQFPVISPSLLQDEKFMSVFPKIDFSNVNAPTPRMMEVFFYMDVISTSWNDSFQSNSIFQVVHNSFYLMKEYEKDFNSYLSENFQEWLNFFGLVNYKSGHKYFEKKLEYLPDHFLITTTLLILLRIQLHFKNDNAPFLEWKRLSAIKVPDSMPAYKDFKAMIPEINRQYGNFWAGMNNFLNSKEDIYMFLSKNKNIMDLMLYYRSAWRNGELTYEGDTFTDNYAIRLAFLRVLKYNDSGKHFNFPIYTDYKKDRGIYCNVSIVNHYCFLYLELMVHDLNAIYPEIWDTPLGNLFPTLPPEKIRPIDDNYLMEKFEWFKKEWAMTAEYAFFGQNRAQWPPYIPQVDWDNWEKNNSNDANYIILKFIMTYPPPRLKVPPFSFGEWKRKTEGWHRVFEEQWKSYFSWARHNAYAKDKLNWVFPGEQMKNLEGELLFYLDDKGKQQPLLNTYPDLGIMDLDENYGKGFRFLLPWVAAADWIWGDNFWDFVNGAVRKVFKLVIDALIALYNFVGGLFPFIIVALGLFGGYLLFGRSSEAYPSNQQT
ncbi:MAG TPA: hypothetical protein VFP45_03410 [Candidatus Nitrosotalea sp.]|nr:hypothetical protein [Candidatus Nitrosotalea sp.]